MRILVTGGCGFVGSNLTAAAIARGDEVVVLDDLSREGAGENRRWLESQGEFQFVQVDIRNEEDVVSTVVQANPEAVFHVAGQVAMADSLLNPRRDFEINAVGTLNVLEAVRERAPNAAVVYASTNKVYGDLEQVECRESTYRYECVQWPNGFDESLPLDFRTPYGCSKGAAEQYVLDYAKTFGLRAVVFRHSSIYGDRQFATYDQGWVGWFCSRAIAARSGDQDQFTIAGNGKQVRDVLYVSDVVDLYFAAVDRIDGVTGEVFNIGGGLRSSVSLLELFAKLEALCDQPLSYRSLPTRQSDQKVFIADVRKAERMLAWSPRVSVDEGIARILGWLSSSSGAAK